MTGSSRIVVAEGAWAAEAALLDAIDAALPAGELPSARVTVVVPSRSLRDHLLGRLAARRAAWLGLEVTTLLGLASAVLRRTGAAPVSGAPLVPLLVRRLAAREKALVNSLGPLVDGYDEIAGAVRDLLDAGFVEAHLEAVDERLALERATVGAGAVERAQAIARAAAGVRQELTARALVAPGDLLALAAERIAADPESSLPARLFVHGFADLTGVGSDLLEAIVRHREAVVVFDAPPDLDGRTTEWRFGRRLLDRLRGAAKLERIAATSPCPVPLALTTADPAREARAAVGWLAAGLPSDRCERWALVAREADGDLPAWARELDRQGLPGSAESAAPGALARRAAGVVELLAAGANAPLALVLALAEERLGERCGLPVSDLRLAFALAGVRTLAAAVALAPPAAAVDLPVADRIAVDEGRAGRLEFRRVPAASLAAAIELLATLEQRMAASRRTRRLAAQFESTRAWLASFLPEAEAGALAGPLAGFAEPPFAAIEVDADEWRRLVEQSWRENLGGALGTGLGAGGGVALLAVTAARGRTFDRLVVTGLSRDRFPRPVSADPLLPDALRLRLRELLPDLPVKAEGHDEERYLFAQLVGAARDLALVRPRVDGEGRPLAPSPLLDELLRRREVEAIDAGEPPRPCALEVAVAAALRLGTAALAPPLAAAIEEARGRFGDSSTVAAQPLAAARTSLLALRSGDPADPHAARLGAFLGAVGASAALDPRQRAPSVTVLERLAGCGWRTFLERVLRLAPLPELIDGLPALPARLVGNIVHGVLEQMLPQARGIPLAEALAGPEQRCPWPPADDLQRRVRAAARRELAAEGLDPALFAEWLGREALVRLDSVRELDWPHGARELLAVEAKGEATLDAGGRERRIPFRVDRVERIEGTVVLTDYKSGGPITTAVKAPTRAEHLARKMTRGEALQLPVYLLALRGEPALARYLFLKEGLDERLRELTLTPAEVAATPLAELFATLFEAWDAGAFVPRLYDEDPSTPFAGCAYCEVREACVQGDSAARQRLARWANASDGGSGWDHVARRWWRLRASASVASESEEEA